MADHVSACRPWQAAGKPVIPVIDVTRQSSQLLISADLGDNIENIENICFIFYFLDVMDPLAATAVVLLLTKTARIMQYRTRTYQNCAHHAVPY